MQDLEGAGEAQPFCALRVEQGRQMWGSSGILLSAGAATGPKPLRSWARCVQLWGAGPLLAQNVTASW